MPAGEVRVDKWLWGVRVYKTRSQATDGCRAGHVRVGGVSVKPAHPVRVGDTVEVHVEGWTRTLEVAGLVERRVSAVAAADLVVDHSPPRPAREEQPAPLFVRLPATGRPTKRERRDLDRFRGR